MLGVPEALGGGLECDGRESHGMSLGDGMFFVGRCVRCASGGWMGNWRLGLGCVVGGSMLGRVVWVMNWDGRNYQMDIFAWMVDCACDGR